MIDAAAIILLTGHGLVAAMRAAWPVDTADRTVSVLMALASWATAAGLATQ